MSQLDAADIPIIGGSISGRITLQPGSVLTDNEHGIDNLVRQYFAFTDEVVGLLPKRGTPDETWPTLRVSDRQIIEGKGKTCLVNLTFKGLVADELPPIVVRGGWAEQSTQVGMVTTRGTLAANGPLIVTAPNYELPPNVIEEGNLTITFRAPTTTILYVSKTEPREPRFPGYLIAAASQFRIIDCQPASNQGRPVFAFAIRTTAFDVEPAGAYWQVTETNSGILSSRQGSNLDKNVGSAVDLSTKPAAAHPLEVR